MTAEEKLHVALFGKNFKFGKYNLNFQTHSFTIEDNNDNSLSIDLASSSNPVYTLDSKGKCAVFLDEDAEKRFWKPITVMPFVKVENSEIVFKCDFYQVSVVSSPHKWRRLEVLYLKNNKSVMRFCVYDFSNNNDLSEYNAISFVEETFIKGPTESMIYVPDKDILEVAFVLINPKNAEHYNICNIDEEGPTETFTIRVFNEFGNMDPDYYKGVDDVKCCVIVPKKEVLFYFDMLRREYEGETYAIWQNDEHDEFVGKYLICGGAFDPNDREILEEYVNSL